MGNNKDKVYSIGGQNVISHFCYDDPGYYTVTLQYFDANEDVVVEYKRNIYIPETGWEQVVVMGVLTDIYFFGVCLNLQLRYIIFFANGQLVIPPMG